MRLRATFLALLGLVCFAGRASAADFTIVYDGTVSSSTNGGGSLQGVFGLVGTSSLDGKAFTAVFTLHVPTPGATVYDDGTQAYIEGTGAANPVTGVLTINGVSEFFGMTYGQAYQRNSPGLIDEVHHQARSQINNATETRNDWLYLTLASYTHDFVSSTDYTQPLDYSAQPGDQNSNTFTISRYNFGTSTTTYGTGLLNVSRVTISAASAVPEPGSWAMMIGGLGLAGVALRRRNSFGRLANA